MTAREFNQNPSAAMRAVDEGAEVVITSRGTPAYVVVRYDDYQARRRGRSLARNLGMDTLDEPDATRATLDPRRVK